MLLISKYIFYTSQVGKTALHYAIEFKSVEIAALLLQHPSCSDINLTDAVSRLTRTHNVFHVKIGQRPMAEG